MSPLSFRRRSDGRIAVLVNGKMEVALLTPVQAQGAIAQLGLCLSEKGGKVNEIGSLIGQLFGQGAQASRQRVK